jgi:hypothetical protein
LGIDIDIVTFEKNSTGLMVTGTLVHVTKIDENKKQSRDDLEAGVPLQKVDEPAVSTHKKVVKGEDYNSKQEVERIKKAVIKPNKKGKKLDFAFTKPNRAYSEIEEDIAVVPEYIGSAFMHSSLVDDTDDVTDDYSE